MYKDFVNKVLMISYHFPPIAGGGVFRTLKYAKYLPIYGWQPIILSVKKSKFAPIDKTLLDKISNEVLVFRTNTFESKLYRYAPYTFGINPKWYQIPDAFIGWLPFALAKAKEIVKKEKPDLIYSTSPPVTSNLIALLLKKKTGLPWIADFRDPWTDNFTTIYPTNTHYNIEKHMEYNVFKNADKIISVAEKYNNKLKTKYHEINSDKFSTITNGYDPDDFKNIKKIKYNKFTVTYVGSFYKNQSPEYFLKALRKAMIDIESFSNDVEVKFVGKMSKMYWNITKKYELDKIVSEIGYVSHKKAIECMINSSCLLFIIGIGKGSDVVFSGKIFEYLASGTPIIATVPTDSIAADLIKETNTGKVVNTNDVDGIKNAILDFYDKWKNNKLTIDQNWKVIKKYSRKELTIKLANIFNEICKK